MAKNITTSISLSSETFSNLQKISREQGTSMSTLVSRLINQAVEERNKRLAEQYQEAENDPARKELIADLQKLDDEDWPHE